MADNRKRWLRIHREAAGFSAQKKFALELGRRLQKSIGSAERDIGGWERCDKRYRDQSKVSYDVIAELLNENLPEKKQVTTEQLHQDHKSDIRYCEVGEQREHAAERIDGTPIRDAIAVCAPELQEPLLRVWDAIGDVDLASKNIVTRIRAGEAKKVLPPFSRVFDDLLSLDVASPALCEQIWGVVEAVTAACVVPGEYSADQHHETVSKKAWLIRIRLLVEKGLAINGIASKKGAKLDDEATHALITEGISPVSDPLQRVWELVCRLVERYQPMEDKPPKPQNKDDTARLMIYCEDLNASLDHDSETEKLFFHLMKSSESEEVINLLKDFLPDLIGFISRKTGGPSEGLLIDNENMLGIWIARWLYRTKNPNTAPQPTPPPEKNNMTVPTSNQQSITVTAGNGANVTLITGQDRSSPSNQQTNIDPSLFLSKLDELLEATKQESSSPSTLRREIRTLQNEVEDSNTVPSNFMERLTGAVPNGVTLGNQATGTLHYLNQLWQSAFGAGV